MNITEYFTKEQDDFFIYRGRISLQKNYSVIDANETCYRYLGDNAALPITSVTHPEDAESVKEALQKVHEAPQRIIFRLLGVDNHYHYMYGVVTLNGRQKDGFDIIDIHLVDIMGIQYKYDKNYASLLKYRKLMSLSDKMYFEYSYEDRAVNIFEYSNDRANVQFHMDLNKLHEQVMQDNKYSFKQKAEFENLYEILTDKKENLDMEVDGEIFNFTGGYVYLKGNILYKDHEKFMMVATITSTGQSKGAEKYYMSPHAFDNATGVYNKRAISELAMDALATAANDGSEVYLSVLDIDDFKNINDTFGHMAGDEIIAKVAEILKSALGDRGYVGRFGGDEFLVVMDNTRNETEMHNIFKTIRKHISWLCSGQLNNAEVTISIGIARYPDHATNYEDLFKIADKCLYIAKAKGKNRFIYYIPELHKDYEMSDVADKRQVQNMPDSFSQSCRAIVDMLWSDRTDRSAFDADVDELIQRYNIDRISVYHGPEVKKCYVRGRSEEVMETMTMLQAESFEDAFDKNGLYAVNSILPLKEIAPDFYKGLQAQGTEGFAIIRVSVPNEEEYYVMFEMVNRRRKWSVSDKGLLYITAQMIVRRLLAR